MNDSLFFMSFAVHQVESEDRSPYPWWTVIARSIGILGKFRGNSAICRDIVFWAPQYRRTWGDITYKRSFHVPLARAGTVNLNVWVVRTRRGFVSTYEIFESLRKRSYFCWLSQGSDTSIGSCVSFQEWNECPSVVTSEPHPWILYDQSSNARMKNECKNCNRFDRIVSLEFLESRDRTVHTLSKFLWVSNQEIALVEK